MYVLDGDSIMTFNPENHSNLNCLDDLTQSWVKYQDILLEYYTLAISDSLNDIQADRMAEILTQAEADEILNFWIEEADYLIAHRLGLIDEDFIRSQQNQLRSLIRKAWIDLLLHEIQDKTKAVQVYLKHQGAYQGEINGKLDPSTHAAIQSLQQKNNCVTNHILWNDRLQSWSVM
jgi:hypothetical protein